MKTLAILARKGGTGKTTLAVHLAVAAERAGLRTLLADMDPQRSAVEWRRERREQGPAVAEVREGALFPARQGAVRAGYDFMIMDTRSSGDLECAEAARLADLCLLPVRPSFFDVRAIARTVELVVNLRRPALLVLNQAPSRRAGDEPRLIRDAIEELDRYGLPIAPVGLRYRAAFQNALKAGQAAQESAPDSPAAFEMNALWAHVKRELWPDARAGWTLDDDLADREAVQAA